MEIRLDVGGLVEIVAVVGSALLGLMALAGGWRDRRARLFGLLCLSLATWKAFEFADPALSTAFWVDAMGWSSGALAIALSFHFIVSYLFHDRDEPRFLWAAAYPPMALFIGAGFAGWLTRSRTWQVLYGAFFTGVIACGLGMVLRFFMRERRKELAWAFLGALSLALGAWLQLLLIVLSKPDFRSQTYGMLAFELFFGYDIVFAGFLRERKEHLKALEELGLRERRLEDAEAAFRRLTETSFDILLTLDRGGNILAVSTEREEIEGFRVRELLGRGYQRFLTPEDQARVADAVARGMAGEKIRYFEVSLRRPDGRPLILQVTATRLRGEEGVALVIARDVTGARKMERELQERNLLLEEANRRLRELDTLKTELVGVVGHELRSPLTVIYSYAAALKDHWEKMSEERKLECIDHVLRECNRLNRMVENVLGMSRIDSDRLFLHRQKGDLVAVLGEVTREMAMAPGAHPMELATTLRSLEMEADWDKVKQVVINLLDNAFRFSPGDATVTVTCEVRDGAAVVKVKDRGPGVPPEKRDRLFEKFTQSKAEGMERGLGLGLYIVRTFVEAHAGEVWIEDEDGYGTVMAFSLPLGGGED
ncbi:MAG: PAS domain S-box protein [Actinobacteria bacterium]|nr:PAS domain S-box protein [Actinomycetota bacterium]MDI6831601.1 ATP-binding protein [Actinomycetota bacterium]